MRMMVDWLVNVSIGALGGSGGPEILNYHQLILILRHLPSTTISLDVLAFRQPEPLNWHFNIVLLFWLLAFTIMVH